MHKKRSNFIEELLVHESHLASKTHTNFGQELSKNKTFRENFGDRTFRAEDMRSSVSL